ncbi:MAG TPA: hypothetical protein VGK50_06520 [Coriobacteriia bacterium]|jgi:hypothetical protein
MDRERKKFLHKQWIKVLLASLLLNTLILAGMLTSSPTVSPASTWMTAVDTAVYKVRPVSGGQALADLHARASQLSKEQCMACHGTMIASKFTIHRLHLTSELLPGLVCHDCHKKISLEKRSNTHVVRLVDVGVCKKCHSPFPGLQPTSPMKPADFKADCTTCHSGKHAYRHDQPYLSHVIAPRECAGCHGGRVLPWTAAHEKDDWVAKHGKIALVVGKSTCMKCHELGFAFCNDCHSKKPPSHQPREMWLLQHQTAAKSSTPSCFTCHKPDFCKKCHVNHTANWRNEHFKFVIKNGADACLNCHSATFCETCHVSGKQMLAPTLAPQPSIPASEMPAGFTTGTAEVTSTP